MSDFARSLPPSLPLATNSVSLFSGRHKSGRMQPASAVNIPPCCNPRFRLFSNPFSIPAASSSSSFFPTFILFENPFSMSYVGRTQKEGNPPKQLWGRRRASQSSLSFSQSLSSAPSTSSSPILRWTDKWPGMRREKGRKFPPLSLISFCFNAQRERGG